MNDGMIVIVGMPRSGTKLLRSVLNNSPQVAIPEFETELLPYWLRHWEEFGKLQRIRAFEAFYRRQSGLPFFIYVKKSGQRWSARDWHAACEDFTIKGVFEGLLRCATGTPVDAPIRLGDKSPSYLFYIEQLAAALPGASFVHIIRDVRDVALSANRAWGKAMERTAARWRDGMAAAEKYRGRAGLRYREIRYEALIHSPAPELEALCDWLGIRFQSAMLEGLGAVENLGDAAGAAGIVSGNRQKFRWQLSTERRRAIERIAGAALVAAGYRDVEIEGSGQLGRLRSMLLKLSDGFGLLLRSISRNGPLTGLRMTMGFRRLAR